MALTFRNVKGNALTITELDGNFRHFTGSHEVSGSITTTGVVTDSITGNLDVTGSLTTSGSLTVGKGFILSGSNFEVSGSNVLLKDLPTTDPGVSGSLFTTSSLLAGFSSSAVLLMVSQG